MPKTVLHLESYPQVLQDLKAGQHRWIGTHARIDCWLVSLNVSAQKADIQLTALHLIFQNQAQSPGVRLLMGLEDEAVTTTAREEVLRSVFRL